MKTTVPGIFDASLPDDDPRCKGPADPADVHIAYPTGSFSTNYLKLAFFLTRIHAPSDDLAPSPEGERLVQQVPDTKTTFAAIVEVNSETRVSRPLPAWDTRMSRRPHRSRNFPVI